MAYINTDEDFSKRVRSLTAADGDTYTDTLITSFDYQGVSEMMVKKNVPLWQDILDGDDSERIALLKSCVVYQTAVILAPNVKSSLIKIRQTTNAKIEYFDSTEYDLLISGLLDRLNFIYLELNAKDFNGFSSVELTNPGKRYNGSGFDFYE